MNKFCQFLLLVMSLILSFQSSRTFAQDEGNKRASDEYTLEEKCFKLKNGNACLKSGFKKEKLKDMDQAQKFFREACDREVEIGCQKYDCNLESANSCYQVSTWLEAQNQLEESRKFLVKSCNLGEESACYKMRGAKGSDILYWASILLIGLAVFIVAKSIFDDEDQFKAVEKMEEGGIQNLAEYGIVLKYSRPFFRRYVSPIISSMKNKKGIREKYKRPLAGAGLTEVLTPDDLYAFKIFLIVGFPLMFFIIRGFLEETWPASLVPVISLIGYVYPDIWISGRAKQRQKDIIMNMPFAVDMLALSVEAGLDFIAAMAKVVEKSKKNALTEEFEKTIKEIKIGASRSEALRAMAWRCDLIQISSFCATLIAADSVGASIGPILKALSIEIRQKRSSEIEKAGATAATKILFPMLFLIVPAVFIIVGAPLVLEAMGFRK
jgi:tight adherence protein C